MSSRIPRERGHDAPLCRECWAPLTWEQAGELDCTRCMERKYYWQRAYDLGKFHGLWVRWQDVRDHGSTGALQRARARRGVRMEGFEWADDGVGEEPTNTTNGGQITSVPW